jgi:methyltransferase (TIGR00027 family)
MVLLSEASQKQVEKARNGGLPRTLRGRMEQGYLQTQAAMMVARTVAIDDAIRAAGAEQLVILGAGLDGRAWRMPELRNVSVFEVDHPDSQREKRERIAKLTPVSCDIRFVAVDFEHDALDTALAAAGHDPRRRTTWVWEGVVMYLTRRDIAATLSVVARRSAPGSALIVAYHAPAWRLKLVGLALRRIGEPLRSAFKPGQMAELLAEHGFLAVDDRDLGTIGSALSAPLGELSRRVKHTRIVVAERRSTAS